MLDCEVTLTGTKEFMDSIERVRAAIVLLSKGVLYDPECVAGIFMAIRAGVPLIPIVLEQGGYDFADSRNRLGGSLSDWAFGLPNDDFLPVLETLLESLAEAAKKNGATDTINARVVQTTIFRTLLNIIAIPFSPHGGPNHYHAVMSVVHSRIPHANKASNARRKRPSLTRDVKSSDDVKSIDDAAAAAAIASDPGATPDFRSSV